MVLLFAVAATAWTLPITVRENKFYIQTEQPEENFVVICRWRLSFLAWNKTTSRVLIGRSNMKTGVRTQYFLILAKTALRTEYSENTT